MEEGEKEGEEEEGEGGGERDDPWGLYVLGVGFL